MAACVALTTSGLMLVNWQDDGALDAQSSPPPLRSLCFPMLGPLLASLVQFSQGAEFSYVELSAGVHVSMSTDHATQVTVAVLFRSTCVRDRELARLKSLVMLRQLVASFGDDIARLAKAHAVQSQAMADSYTLTQALEGIIDDGGDAHETKSEFLVFERECVAPTMKRSASDCPLRSLPPLASTDGLIRALLLNAETGALLGSIDVETPSSDRWRAVLNSAHTGRLVTRAALALRESFPLLRHSYLSMRANSSSGSANECSPPALTLLLRLSSRPSAPLDTCVYFGLQMLSIGVFAAGAMFSGEAATAPQHGNNPDKTPIATARADFDQLESVLTTDERGSRMLHLLRGLTAADPRDPSCRLFIGSSGVPKDVAMVLDAISRSWVPASLRFGVEDTCSIANSSGSAELDTSDWGVVDVEQQLASVKLSSTRGADLVE